MRLNDLGEFGLIERIRDRLPLSSTGVIVGIGDDVAVLDATGPEYILATCDSQVEDIHFIRNAITPYQLGRKTVAVNVSDIAATGGNPSWALVSLALPPDLDSSFVDELYRGMLEEMQLVKAAIVGGNISRANGGVLVDFFLLGKVSPEHMVLRKGARVGDAILVTGAQGDSRAGLELIRRPELAHSETERERLMGRHLTPRARFLEGAALGRTKKIHSMVDVSDGLISDIGHICRAGRVSAEIWAGEVPVSPEAAAIAGRAGENVTNWALTGGEDYELLFTTTPEYAGEAVRIVEAEAGAECRVIGRIVPGASEVRVIMPDGADQLLPMFWPGWDHFRGGAGEDGE